MQLVGPITSRDALAIYLQDHHAGAQAGLALARRVAGSQRGNPMGEVLRELVREIEEDEQTLRRVMDELEVRPSAVKDLGAKAAERVGRLKLNGQLLGSSPLSPVIELEGLLSGVKSKQHVWLLLRDATGLRVDDVDPDRMLARAESQLDRLHDLWLDAARAAFPHADRPVPSRRT